MDQIIKTLGIEWPVVWAQLISMIVLLVLLWRVLYKPFESILRQRREQIANDFSNADAQQAKAAELRAEYEGHLARIAEEARQRLDQAVKDAEAARQRMLEAAKTDIQDLHQRGQSQLALEREQLRRELRQEMADIAVMAANTALRNQMTPTLHSAVIDQVIRELEHPSTPIQ